MMLIPEIPAGHPHRRGFPRPKPPETGVYPFWFWNGDQEETELLRQLRLFKRNGCCGAVIHSRTGNRIPYLGKMWFARFESICREAGRLGMKIWIYDEDGYPSGNAGRRVQKQYPHLIQKTLFPRMEEADPGNPAYAAYRPDAPGTPVDETAVPPGTKLLRFVLTGHPLHVDVLHPETCRRFMDMTHRKYERLKRYFGDVIQAVYTDDLAFQMFHVPGYVFSPALEEECLRQGRPLKTILGHIALDTPESADARKFFYLAAQRLFLENFVRPQMEWCHRNGLNYLGHLCGDEGPLAQTVRNFASAQPFYHTEDIPSVDDFFTEMRDHRYLARSAAHDPDRVRIRDTHKRSLPLLTFKLAASAARCFADGNFSSETLAFLGWDCTPDFVQPQMLFELSQGVNLITHHAYYYTVAGVAKRDCPPSWSYQQPMFPVFGKMNRMWTRLAGLLRRGKYDTETLLIYPSSLLSLPKLSDISRQALTCEPDTPVNRAESALSSLILELTRRHIGFDILDETILNSHALLSRSGAIRVGAMEYRKVIRPEKLPLSDTLEHLLKKFGHRGGTVLSPADAVGFLSPDLALTGDGSEEIFVSRRKVKNCREYLLLNLSGRDLHPGIELQPEDSGAVLYDPAAGKRISTRPGDLNRLLLRKGAALMLMSPDFSAPTLELSSSQYAEYTRSIRLSPASVVFSDGNIRRIMPGETDTVTLESGASVTAFLAERADISRIRINGRRFSPSDGKVSRYDCGILEIPCRGIFRTGENTVQGRIGEPVFLKGKFLADAESFVLRTPQLPAGHCDLAAAGWPNYCGKITYTYRFSGKFAQLEINSANAARIRINGKEAGFLFGSPHFLGIEKFCGARDNLLEIELFPQFGNFIADSAPYGIKGVTLWKT